uniref:C2H2-type domain-containing protein n=1 Tax=Xenopus tropicalis TaxID=8364 RepID=A0A803JES4_XENTR
MGVKKKYIKHLYISQHFCRDLMGMTEEPNETVCWFKNKEQRKERILNLTLEIIYLLTGEVRGALWKKSPTVGLGALHAPGSVIQKENDKKILELISNIIQLLTGEVGAAPQDVSIYFSLEEWEYIKGNKALYKEGIKEEEEPKQLDCKAEGDMKATVKETMCCNNEPSKIGAEGADVCADGNFTNPEISPAEQPPPANGIKEEEATLCERGNQSDCSINPLTEQIQGTDTPTAIMGCSLNNSSADNSISDDIKEEAASWEEGSLSDFRIITVSEIQETNTSDPIMGCDLNNSLLDNYISVVIKEEEVSCEEDNQSDCSINPLTEQTQGTDTPTPIIGNSLNDNLSEIQNSSRKSYNRMGVLQGMYKCSECHKRFSSKSTFVRHQRRYHKIEKRVSSKGGKLMARRSRSDLKGSKSNGDKLFTCSECGKNFKHRSSFYVHRRFHTGGKPFSCTECGKCFSQVSDLDIHHRIHLGEKPFTCSQCGKCFAHLSDLKVHQRIHTGEKPYSCSECGKCFTQRSHLSAHLKSHTGEKPFTCSECGKCFTHLGDLKRHLRSHTGEKPFTCSQCGKAFIRRAHLSRHQKCHLGEKPFSCSQCGKCFTQRTHLERHHRSHTGEKPFSCFECGKGFAQRTHLLRHHKVHTREKAFSCSECGECFAENIELDLHQQSHARDEPNSSP